jgi:hypothetical protein
MKNSMKSIPVDYFSQKRAGDGKEGCAAASQNMISLSKTGLLGDQALFQQFKPFAAKDDLSQGGATDP